MSAERKQFRLGLVGYGEIGSTLGRGLRGAGLETIASYDKYAFDGPYADLIQSRAKEVGVTLVRSNQELADAADLIVSVTPGSASLESAEAFEFGETNIGLFILKNQTMFQVLRELRTSYWDETTDRYKRAKGELGFPNELISALASRKFGVFGSPFADPREEQGIKRFEDLSRCERFLSELREDSLS